MGAPALQARHFRSPNQYAGLQHLLQTSPETVDATLVADLLAECATPGDTLIVGMTGSVAAGKTTLSSAIASHLRSTMRIEVVSTDGFLHPNDALIAQGRLMRKGFPESYDIGLLAGMLQRVRLGPVRIPGYSHTHYDRAPSLDRTIDRPDILLVEGLGLSPRYGARDPSKLLDLLIYVDASEHNLEDWFVSRFMKLWREAEGNPSSFYTRFRSMSEDDATVFARKVWVEINLPNLREHIASARDVADIILSKAMNHSMRLQIQPRELTSI